MKLIKLFEVALLTMILTSCSSMGIGTDNSSKPAPLPEFKTELGVTSLWSTSTGRGNNHTDLVLAPAFDNGKIFTADAKGKVSAIDSRSGKTIWQMNTKVPVTSGVSAGNGFVFVGTNDANIVALHQTDGTQVWKSSVADHVLTGIQTVNNMGLAKTIDGKLYAFNVENGHSVWGYDHGAPTLILRGSSMPQVANGRVVAGYADGKLAAYSLGTGRLLWERTIAMPGGLAEVERMVDIDANPKVADNVIYVATYQGNIAAVELATGRLIWQNQISSYTGLVLDTNRVYITDAQGMMWAFNRQNGNVLWKQEALKDRVLTAPAMTANAIIVADGQGYAHWLAKNDGRFLARTHINKSGVTAAPLVVDGSIFVLSNDGKLTAYRETH